LDAILEGLPQDYAFMIFVIESKFTTPLITEVKALLLAHEYRIARFNKKSLSPSVNYSQGYRILTPLILPLALILLLDLFMAAVVVVVMELGW